MKIVHIVSVDSFDFDVCKMDHLVFPLLLDIQYIVAKFRFTKYLFGCIVNGPYCYITAKFSGKLKLNENIDYFFPYSTQ